jgi:hypothetical protein
MVSVLVFGAGFSQPLLLFGRDEKPGRAAFLISFALVDLVTCLFALLWMRMGSSAFRRAGLTRPT